MSDESGLRRFYDKTPISPHETDEGKARAREYRLALGTFVDAFAKVEQAMFIVLRWHTKTSTGTARAVFSGARTETISSFLKRLAEIGSIDAAEWAQLQPVIDQLRIINDLRNTLLHHVTEGIEAGDGYVTDALRALNEDRIRTFPISPTILKAMTYDCRKIFLHLVARHAGRPALRGKHPELEEALESAWRYIPPPPPQPPRRGDTKTKRSRRSSPSPETPDRS